MRKANLVTPVWLVLVVGGLLQFATAAEVRPSSTTGWESEKSLAEGIQPVVGRRIAGLSPAIAFNVTGDKKWTLIAGELYGNFAGYYWDGTKWVSDRSRITGIKRLKGRSAPALTYDLSGDKKWTLITRSSRGQFFGYYWNGTEKKWVQDSSRVKGLEVVAGNSGLVIIDNLKGEKKKTLISGNAAGTFNAYCWDGGKWVSDSSRVEGLGDVGSHSRVTAGFDVFADKKWTLITGNASGKYAGYYWNRSKWVPDPSRVKGLKDVGRDSTPAVACNLRGDEKWILISGVYVGPTYGYFCNRAEIKKIPPIADAAVTSANIRATTAHLRWKYDHSWNHRIKYSTKRDLGGARWSDWHTDTDDVDVKLYGLQPQTTYYYEAYTYVPWDAVHYVKSPVRSFTTIPGQKRVAVKAAQSIQDAIDTLPPAGGVVELLPGVHNLRETIQVRKSNVTIQGTRESVIRSHDPSKDIFRVNQNWEGGADDPRTVPNLENVTLRGFKVTAAYRQKKSMSVVVRVDKVNNLTIEGLDVTSKGLMSVNWSRTRRGRVYYARSKGMKILRNTLRHGGMSAVLDTGAEVAYNKMYDYNPSGYAMYFEAGNTGLSIHDNYMENAGAIQTESQNVHIYGNTIMCKGGRLGITARYNTANILIENNIITGAKWAGIQFYTSTGLKNQTARNNIIYGCSGNGIELGEIGWVKAKGTSTVNILNNVMYNCGGDGIGRGSKTESKWIVKITNNIITNNAGFGIDVAHQNITETHGYNDVWGNKKGNYNKASPGKGDISAAPLFAAPSKGDFHLKSRADRWDPKAKKWVKDTASSPCIDAGDPKSEHKNEPQPNGRRTNIGAYGNTAQAAKSSN